MRKTFILLIALIVFGPVLSTAFALSVQDAQDMYLGNKPASREVDTNGDQVVSISELQSFVVQKEVSTRTPMHLTSQSSSSESVLSLGSCLAKPGEHVELPLHLETGSDQVSILSTDVTFDRDVLNNATVSMGPVSSDADKSVRLRQLDSGQLRILVMGFNANAISDGIVAYLHFDVEPGAALDTTLVSQTASGSTPEPTSLTVDGRNGVVDVVGEVPSLPRLSIVQASGSAGEQVKVPVYLHNADDVDLAAISFGISWDQTILSHLDILPGPEASDKDKQIIDPENDSFGKLSNIGVIGMEKNPKRVLENGIVAYLEFTINEDSNVGQSQIKITASDGSDPQGSPQAVYSQDGVVLMTKLGDVNMDSCIDLTDAILSLKVIAGMNPQEPISAGADINGDERIGVEEASFILNQLASD